MNKDNFVSVLKAKLEGKTVSLVTHDGCIEESKLCKLVLSDGSSFVICATELGAWVENVQR